MRISCIHTVSSFVFCVLFCPYCKYSDTHMVYILRRFLLINMFSKNAMSQPTQRLTKMLSPYQLSRSCQHYLVTKAKYISPTHLQYEETLRNLLKIKKLRKYIWASTQGFLISKSKLFRSQFLLNKLSAVYM